VARKRKQRKQSNVEVLSFRASGGYPYKKTILGVMMSFLFLVTLAVIGFLGMYEVLLALVILFIIILVYGLSPALTSHQLGASNLVLRHGWYFKARVPLMNIRDVQETEEGVPGHGVSFLLGGSRLYLTNSRVGLVNIKLHDRQRMRGTFGKNISEIVLNVDDPDMFIQVLRERAGLKELTTADLDRCPRCGSPMVRPEEGKAPEAQVEVHRIEAIFLVHNDGRLVTSYKSGKIKTKEAFSMTGMLTVIQNFVSDAFKRTDGSLKTLEHGDLRILIERGANVYLAVLIEGREPKELRKEMRRVLKEVEQRYEDILDDDWDGEVTQLKDLNKILAQVLWH
jgi:hypothetical protein